MTDAVPTPHARAPLLTRKMLAVVFCIALGLLFAMAVLVWEENHREVKARNMVTHTLLVLKQAIELENEALDMEASQRGYLISGEQSQLAVRDAKHAKAAQMSDALAILVQDNPMQAKRIKQGRIELDTRYQIMQTNSRYSAIAGLDAARMRFQADGVGSIEPMRKILAAVRLQENQLLAKRLRAYDERLAQFQWLLSVGSALALVVLVGCGFALFRQLAYSEQVADQLEQSGEQLRFAYEVSNIGNWELNLATGKTKRSMLHDQIFGHDTPIPNWGYEAFTRYVHPDDAEYVDVEFKKASEQGGDLNFECRIIWQDRTEHWISVHGRIFEGRNGDRTRMLGTISDITARKEAEQAISKLNRELMDRTFELQASNQELESFSYSVSHDLRAPLRHIDGYTRMLLEDEGDQLQPESRRYLDTIIGSARRMGMLIDDLLTFSRLGRKPLAKQQVDMHDLVENILQDFEFSQSGGAARIQIADLPATSGDPILMRQVWVNLLSNAIKYSAPRGDQARIEVSGEVKGDCMHYSVKDNGVGFDMKYAGKLFGVFQRMHPEDQFEGTGVGLAIVHRIISRHGGRVSADAEKEKGACFSFELPISEAVSE
ncbi:MAG: ATP-binding protein [Arenimonas sp.]